MPRQQFRNLLTGLNLFFSEALFHRRAFFIFASEYERTYKEIYYEYGQPDTMYSLHEYIVGEYLSEYVVKQSPYSLE